MANRNRHTRAHKQPSAERRPAHAATKTAPTCLQTRSSKPNEPPSAAEKTRSKRKTRPAPADKKHLQYKKREL